MHVTSDDAAVYILHCTLCSHTLANEGYVVIGFPNEAYAIYNGVMVSGSDRVGKLRRRLFRRGASNRHYGLGRCFDSLMILTNRYHDAISTRQAVNPSMSDYEQLSHCSGISSARER